MADCDPTWSLRYQPSDRTPTAEDLRRAELADLDDQGALHSDLRHADTIPAGSYL